MEWREPIPGMQEQWVFHKGQLEWDNINAQIQQMYEMQNQTIT